MPTIRLLIVLAAISTVSTPLYAQLLGTPARNGAVGSALAAGDFDGDGYMDLAAGAPGEYVGTIPHGAVHVLYGSADGLTGERQQLWTVESLGTPEAELSVQMGQALAAGDFNGDGRDDLAIEGKGTVVFGPRGGVVYVVYGSPTGLSRQAGSQSWYFDREDLCFDTSGRSDCADGPSDLQFEFGHALAAGDFNGDGYDQLAVGIPGLSSEDIFSFGGVLILQSDGRGLIAEGHRYITQDQPEAIVGASEVNDYFGATLESGDVNADGFDDLAIGVTQETIESLGADFGGAVNFLYGSANGLTELGNQFFVTRFNGAEGPADLDWYGSAITIGHFRSAASANPRFADMAIGAPGRNLGEFEGVGLVNVFDGSINGLQPSTMQTWRGNLEFLGFTTPYDRFGGTLENGDFDGDGYDDLAVAKPEANGFHGSFNVLPGSDSGLLAAPWFQWTLDSLHTYPPSICGEHSYGRPCDEQEELGASFAAGDFNMDGFVDLAIGSPGRDRFIENAEGRIGDPDYHVQRAGAVNVLYGSPSGLRNESVQIWFQNIPALPTVPVTPGNNSALVIGGTDTPGSAAAPLAVAWTESADPDSMEVTYEWQISSTESFDDTLASIDAGSQNQLIVTHGELAKVMDDAGVALGEAVTWHHRVVVHDPVAGTPGEPLTITLIRGSIVATEPNELPSAASILGAYPNPTSDFSTLSITTTSPDRVEVRLHDVRGALARTFTADVAPGGHEIDLDASGLPGGVYLYTVTGGGLQATGKLVVLR